MQGEMIGNYLVDNYDSVDLNGDGKISYAMFMGQLGNVEAIYRTQYGVEDANKVLEEKGKPALEYFDSSNTDCYQVDQDGNWSATAANNYMTTNLTQYNEENKNIKKRETVLGIHYLMQIRSILIQLVQDIIKMEVKF